MPIIKRYHVECDFCGKRTETHDVEEMALRDAMDNDFEWDSKFVSSNDDPARDGYWEVKWRCDSFNCCVAMDKWLEGQKK